jgi:hypothetical protein
MALSCGDKVQHVLYPGIPIQALDGEEATWASACRAALANYPCPRCLVSQSDLDKIDQSFTPRTTETMQQVYEDSLVATSKTASENILKAYGLHRTQVCCLLYIHSTSHDILFPTTVSRSVELFLGSLQFRSIQSLLI